MACLPDKDFEYGPWGLLHRAHVGFLDWFGVLPDLKDGAEAYPNRDRSDEPNAHRAVYPSWVNTARRKDLALITLNRTPGNHDHCLHRAVQESRRETGGKDGLVLVNAWNEWTEGCHLEPDRHHDPAFLQATLRAKQRSALTDWTHVGLPANADDPAQDRYALSMSKRVQVKPQQRKGLRGAVLAVRDALRLLRGKKVR